MAAVIEPTASCSPESLQQWWQPNCLLWITHLLPSLLFMDAELLGATAIVKILWSHGPSGVPKPQRRLRIWVHSPARSLFNNIRGGIRSLSYANMKGTSPISVTSEMLERSQGTRGKKCGFLPTRLIPCFKGQQMMKGESRQRRCPALKTLDPSLNESGWAFCLEKECLSSVCLSVCLSLFRSFSCRMVHTQLVKGTAVNNGIYFWGFGSNKNLEFLPRDIYSSKCVFVFLFRVILRIDWYVYLWCFCTCLRWVVLLESREQSSEKALLRCYELRELYVTSCCREHTFHCLSFCKRTLFEPWYL